MRSATGTAAVPQGQWLSLGGWPGLLAAGCDKPPYHRRYSQEEVQGRSCPRKLLEEMITVFHPAGKQQQQLPERLLSSPLLCAPEKGSRSRATSSPFPKERTGLLARGASFSKAVLELLFAQGSCSHTLRLSSWKAEASRSPS